MLSDLTLKCLFFLSVCLFVSAAISLFFMFQNGFVAKCKCYCGTTAREISYVQFFFLILIHTGP